MSIELLRSYRATLVPKGTDHEQAESQADHGTLPTLRLRASNAHRAELAAHHLTGLPVLRVERIEGGAV